MLYNIMLVFAVHQHESAIGIHVSSPSLPPPIPFPPNPRLSQNTKFELPASYSKSPLAICFQYSNVYASMLLSQFVPLSPSTTVVCSVTQSCPILWNPMDCSLLGSSVHRISLAKILEWADISFSRSTIVY